jgi:hypothetical protein
MKNIITVRNASRLLLIGSAVLFLHSCVVYSPYAQQKVKVPDIVQMSKEGRSSKDIIREIRQSHSVYTLKADQLAKLRDEGVQDSVINYMEKTHFDSIRRNQWMNDSYYGYPGPYGYYGGFGFGWPYWGYGWGWGPTIIYSYHHSYGGGFHGGFHGGYHGGMRR